MKARTKRRLRIRRKREKLARILAARPTFRTRIGRKQRRQLMRRLARRSR